MSGQTPSSGITANGRWSCSGCDTRWNGLRLEHCTGCHLSFASTAAGVDPGTLRHEKSGLPMLEQRADGAWGNAISDKERARLAALREAHRG